MVLRPANEYLQHSVLDPLRQHDMVAAHVRHRLLQLAVDAAVTVLRYGPGFHGRSKWNRSAQRAWEFRPSPAASVVSRNAERIGGRVGVESVVDHRRTVFGFTEIPNYPRNYSIWTRIVRFHNRL